MNRVNFLQKKRDIISKKEYYRRVRYPEIPVSSLDLYIQTQIGDRLDLLANRYYKDNQLWWIISVANPNVVRRDSLYLNPGLEIRIPINVDNIIERFEQINE
tara:strand:- start:263 stop:568 length:306 start_codon:yes stop_codon:yes gene_type:complete